jgi:folate-binding protein YgfZ
MQHKPMDWLDRLPHPRPTLHADGQIDGQAAAAAALAADTLDVLAPLPTLGRLRVAGADAQTFLQGQLSCDLRAIGEHDWRFAGYSSPKGRLLAILRIWRDGDDWLLAVDAGIRETTLKRLRMFVLRSKVSLDAEDIASIGLAGPSIARRLAAARLHLPEAAGHLSTGDGGVHLLRGRDRADGAPRLSLQAPVDALAALWPILSQDTTLIGPAAWRRLGLLAGEPTIYPETQDRFVAQMVNLDRLGGVSFDKGCYTGQEVIARLHYLGKLKRRMLRLHAHAEPPAPGTPIYAAESPDQAVGEVVDAAPDGGGSLIAAVMQLGSVGQTGLRLGAADGPVLSPPQPFAPDLPPLDGRA